MAFGNISPIAVRPGFNAKIQLSTSLQALATLSVKTAQARETIDNHDTVGTSSPTVNTGQNVQQTSIQGKCRLRLSLTAQYSAGGTGDPPQFTTPALYGNVGVIAQIGDIIAGATSTSAASALVEDYANLTNESGTIDYSLDMLFNGPYTRTCAAVNA